MVYKRKVLYIYIESTLGIALLFCCYGWWMPNTSVIGFLVCFSCAAAKQRTSTTRTTASSSVFVAWGLLRGCEHPIKAGTPAHLPSASVYILGSVTQSGLCTPHRCCPTAGSKRRFYTESSSAYEIVHDESQQERTAEAKRRWPHHASRSLSLSLNVYTI